MLTNRLLLHCLIGFCVCDFNSRRYGPYAYYSYVAITLYRLFNEVWSNALVTAGFYSDTPQDGDWWLSVILSVLIPCVYVSLGGLRSSLVSDALQVRHFSTTQIPANH